MSERWVYLAGWAGAHLLLTAMLTVAGLEAAAAVTASILTLAISKALGLIDIDLTLGPPSDP